MTSSAPDPSEFETLTQAALRTGDSKSVLDRDCRKGVIPSTRREDGVRWMRKADVDAWKAARYLKLREKRSTPKEPKLHIRRRPVPVVVEKPTTLSESKAAQRAPSPVKVIKADEFVDPDLDIDDDLVTPRHVKLPWED